MAASVTVRVQGLTQLRRALDRAGAGVDDMRDALERIATEVEPDYKRFTPARPGSGRLRGTYRIGKSKARAAIYVGTRTVPYAGVINYGWAGHNIEAQNFVQKGDAVATPKALTALDHELTQLFTQLGLT